MVARVEWRRERVRYAIATTVVVLLAAPILSLAEYHEVEETKSFGILDISGHIRAGYFLDDRGYTGDSERRSTWQEEVFLLSKSFIYHPGFLNIDLGGGPLFVQQSFEDDVGVVHQKDTLFNFLFGLNFLEIKNYPISFYFQRSHPSVTTGLAGRFLTTSDDYGLNGYVSQLFGGSTTARYSISRRDDQGSGFGSVIDNSIDTGMFSLETSYRTADKIAFQYNTLDQVSGSGSAGLPITWSTIDRDTSEITAMNRFGRDGQVEIRQALTRLRQDVVSFGSSSLDNRTYYAVANWWHSEKTRSYFRLRQFRIERESQGVTSTNSRVAELGATGQPTSSFHFDTAIQQDSENQTGFSREEIALRGLLNYTRPIRVGSLGLTTFVRGARVDQDASTDSVQVYDEPHSLVGTAPSSLAKEFVRPGSVVVTNAVQTQIFVEGFDYRLLTVGSTTSVQRLLGGNIADGESVLVDYVYETSGTAEFDTQDLTVTLNAGFWNKLDAFIRYGTYDTDIRSGALSTPVNNRTSLEYGISANNQFLDGWSLSGHYRHLDQDEDISPFVRDALDVSLTTSLRGTWKLVLSGGLTRVDYDNSVEDVDLSTYRIGISGRPFRGAILTYDGSYLRDDGGSLAREQLQHRLNFQWTYRQVRLALRAYYNDNTLGPTQRDSMRVSAHITRVF